MTTNLLNLAKWIKSYGISKVKDLKLSLYRSLSLLFQKCTVCGSVEIYENYFEMKKRK